MIDLDVDSYYPHVMTNVFEKKEPNIRVLNKSMVDGEPWYTVSCLRPVSIWIRTEQSDQEHMLWFENIDDKWGVNFNVFDVHEKFYAILLLKWS